MNKFKLGLSGSLNDVAAVFGVGVIEKNLMS